MSRAEYPDAKPERQLEGKEDARSIGTRIVAGSERCVGAAHQAREAARELSTRLFGPEPEKDMEAARTAGPEGLVHQLIRDLDTQAEVMDDTYRILDSILTRLEH